MLSVKLPACDSPVGVYFLLLKGTIVYIGSSSNILHRIGQHQDKVFDEVRIISTTEDHKLELEEQLIRKHQPKYNKAFNFVRRKKEKPIDERVLGVCRRVCQLRKKRKIKMSALAKACGINKGNLSQIERYGGNMTLATLFAIGDALDADYTWLLFGEL